MQGKRLGEIGAGSAEVADEQSRLTGHRHRERHPASRLRGVVTLGVSVRGCPPRW
jgi:hypothetical protein